MHLLLSMCHPSLHRICGHVATHLLEALACCSSALIPLLMQAPNAVPWTRQALL